MYVLCRSLKKSAMSEGTVIRCFYNSTELYFPKRFSERFLYNGNGQGNRIRNLFLVEMPLETAMFSIEGKVREKSKQCHSSVTPQPNAWKSGEKGRTKTEADPARIILTDSFAIISKWAHCICHYYTVLCNSENKERISKLSTKDWIIASSASKYGAEPWPEGRVQNSV